MGPRHPAPAVRAVLVVAGEDHQHHDHDGDEAEHSDERGGEDVHPGDGTSRDMQEDKVAEIYDYLIRRIPDVRVTSHYDFDRESQRFRLAFRCSVWSISPSSWM